MATCEWLRASRGVRLVAAGAAIVLSCASCAERQRVAGPEINAHELIGQKIRVVTTDGEVYEFLVVDVTADAVVGDSDRVEFDRIALLERRTVNLWKTVCLGGGVILAGLGVVILALLIHGSTVNVEG